MTVYTSDITAGPYEGNDISDDFGYFFRIENSSEIIVFETDLDGNVTTLELDTDYTVHGVGSDDGGYVKRLAGPLPGGYEWYMRSNYQPVQYTSFTSQGPFFPEIHEKAFDKLTYLLQQNLDLNKRAIRVPDSYSGEEDFMLPSPLTNAVLMWGAEGLENYPDFPSKMNQALASGEAADVLYRQFIGTYYGPLAADPVIDPNGDPIEEGDLYWNTTDLAFRVYNGAAWEDAIPNDPPTTVGGNLYSLTNPSAVTFLRINADNTVSTLTATAMRTALGLGTSATLATATVNNVRAGTGNTVVTSSIITDSLATVALTDAATVTVNGASFVNGSLVLAGNRTLGNMTSKVVGRTYKIRIESSAATLRTLTLDTEYVAAVGLDLTGIGNATGNRLLLTLSVETSSLVIVSGVRY